MFTKSGTKIVGPLILQSRVDYKIKNNLVGLLVQSRSKKFYRALKKYPAKMKRQRVGNLLSRKT